MENGSTPSLPLGLSCVRRLPSDREPRVVVVDDDVDSWTRLTRIFQPMGLHIHISARIPEEFLSGRPDSPICLIVAVKPGRNGIQFQEQLAEANVFVPIIFLAECGDVATSVRAMKNGAVDFLIKPFRDEDLLEAIKIGLARDYVWCEEYRSLSILRNRFETLSLRERQVMERIVKGKLNKQVAFDLSISEITVKAHRGKVMRKMKAMSLPELARMADRITHDHLTRHGSCSAGEAPEMPSAGPSLEYLFYQRTHSGVGLYDKAVRMSGRLLTD